MILAYWMVKKTNKKRLLALEAKKEYQIIYDRYTQYVSNINI